MYDTGTSRRMGTGRLGGSLFSVGGLSWRFCFWYIGLILEAKSNDASAGSGFCR